MSGQYGSARASGYDHCKGCSRPIRWAESEKGKPMPFEADPAEDGSYRIEGGAAIYVLPIERVLWPGRLYVAHFALCPQAHAFREGQAQAAARQARARAGLPETPQQRTCAAPGCKTAVGAAHSLCRPHYNWLPRDLRQRLYSAGAYIGRRLREDLEAFFRSRSEGAGDWR